MRISRPPHRPRRRAIRSPKLGAAATAEQQFDKDAPRRQSQSGAEQAGVPAIDELRFTEKQGLIVRPVVTIVNSTPHLDQNGQKARIAGFGDTVLAFALPRSLLGGRLMVGAGPTFIFPTASKDLLSQQTWQVGPDAGAVLFGKQFITYGFAQQWFKVAGEGRDTNQMSGTFNFTYLFRTGGP